MPGPEGDNREKSLEVTPESPACEDPIGADLPSIDHQSSTPAPAADPEAALYISVIERSLGQPVHAFNPSWWTEDWANLSLVDHSHFSFRFERNSYLGTLVDDGENPVFFCAQSAESVDVSRALAPTDGVLRFETASSNSPIQESVRAAFRDSPLASLAVVNLQNGEIAAVVAHVENGSLAAILFQAKGFIAVEHYSPNSAKQVFTVGNRDVSHKSISLHASERAGRDVISSVPVKGEVHRISFATAKNSALKNSQAVLPLLEIREDET